MKQFLSISLLLLLCSCASYPVKNKFRKTNNVEVLHNPYFSNLKKDYVYKANIEVYGNTFGGLLIIKKTGAQKHRIAFTTEMGNKLFDFSFHKNNFKVNYIIEKLNKKMLINILEKDFKILITESPKIIDTFNSNNLTIFETSLYNTYYYKTNTLFKIVKTNGRKEKTKFLFRKISNNFAEDIQIIHSNIKLKINLKAI
ncbi:MAG: hypothetical protein ACPG6B_00025 [Oceanihabitans sp.]